MSKFIFVAMMSRKEDHWIYLVQILEQESFHLVYFPEKDDFLEYCEKHSPQAIILDPPFVEIMPAEVIQAIQRISNSPIMVLLHSYSQNDASMLNAVADLILKKPFTAAVLVANLKA